ncbi:MULTISPECIES: HNH endonuclease [Staphylococcus]|uniref:HNH endonuclease n=1 Tax=Staphylococcus TaxID=1279 RepID=UPI001F61E9B7|nr:hypothetical protein [Staphylococcus nepalensis]
MELKLIKESDDEILVLNQLNQKGMKGNIQDPRLIKGSLLDFELEKVDVYINRNNSDLENVDYKEGKVVTRYSPKFERNHKLRKRAIDIHGTSCKVCGFNFEKFYNDIGEDFIEIHHIKPMFTIRKEVEINPETDLIPDSSNCYKMIYRHLKEPISIENLINSINNNFHF